MSHTAEAVLFVYTKVTLKQKEQKNPDSEKSLQQTVSVYREAGKHGRKRQTCATAQY